MRQRASAWLSRADNDLFDHLSLELFYHVFTHVCLEGKKSFSLEHYDDLVSIACRHCICHGSFLRAIKGCLKFLNNRPTNFEISLEQVLLFAKACDRASAWLSGAANDLFQSRIS